MQAQWRFSGRIAATGTTSGVRVVVGRWDSSPYGAFTDVMLEQPDGHRVLLAPSDVLADFVRSTYTFDEVRVVSLQVADGPGSWSLTAGPLRLSMHIGRRTPVGHLLQLVPARLAAAPGWTVVTDPGARVLRRGVRTRGEAVGGRREFYGALDEHLLYDVQGSWDGSSLGAMAQVSPPVTFGFGSAPATPSVVRLVTTVRLYETARARR